MVLPSSIMTLIPENHIIRVVNDIIDSIDISALIEKYQGREIPSKDLSENINKHFNDDKKLKKKKKILDDDYSSRAKKYEEYI
jgi:hypothetical protein